MPAPLFDLVALYEAVDDERQRKELSWAALARAVGVSAATIRRYESAEDAEADGVLALVRWLGVAPEHFTGAGPAAVGLLPDPDDGYVRVDMDLVAEAAGESDGAAGRTRTTIQRLARAANRSGKPIASLTRLSRF